MKITVRAVKSGELHILPVVEGVQVVRHRLPVVPGACPFSGNPVKGWIEIRYSPTTAVLEVVDLARYVAWVSGGREGAPQSAEEVATQAARDCSAALGRAVWVCLCLHLRPSQRLVVKATAGGLAEGGD
jgi:NADPH-dependent 7-cyano-7-deazaguanine reductase QueF